MPSYGSSQPIAYEFPNRNSRGWGDNPEATAKKFVDFVLSEESQTAVAAALNLRPLRAGIPVNEKMIPDSEIKQFETYSTAFVAEHKAEIVKMYLDHVEMNME